MKSKVRKNKNYSRKFLFYLIVFLVFVFLLLGFFIFNEYGINFNKIDRASKHIAKDECSFIAGQIIHTINNEDECGLKCISLCLVVSKDFSKSNFTLRENNCNLCECDCD